MVDRLPLDTAPTAQPTLTELWGSLVARQSRRVAAAILTIGLAASLVSRVLDLTWAATFAAAIVAAFGADALLRAGGLRVTDRLRSVGSVAARMTAAVAALAIALTILGVLFGGKIEAMRR